MLRVLAIVVGQRLDLGLEDRRRLTGETEKGPDERQWQKVSRIYLLDMVRS